MKRTALAVMIVVVFAASCAQAPTATPSIELPTPTPRIETATPTATITPTTTPKPSPTSTATLIPPTVTPKPVEISWQQGMIVFQDDFTTGLNDGRASAKHWNAPSLAQHGATVEIVQDPTNSADTTGKPRGNVMKVTTQTPVELPWGPGPWQAGYPAWFNFHANGDGYVSIIPQTAGVQADVWVDPQIDHASLLSVHRKPASSDVIRSVAGMEIHNHDQITVIGRDNNGKDTRVPCISGLFKPGEWNTFMFLVDVRTGRVLPFINGKFALGSIDAAPIVPVNDEIPGSFSDAHAGINFNSPTNSWSMIPEGEVVYNDNFRVFTATVNTDQ
jgi:hypothetical protein